MIILDKTIDQVVESGRINPETLVYNQIKS